MRPQVRRLVLLPLLAMVAGLLIVTAPSATAAATCSVVAPRRLSVSSTVQTFHARISGNCARAHMDFASWDIEHPSVGVSDILIFDAGQTSDSWKFYDWEHLGTYHVRPRSAWDATSQKLAQNTGRMSVRLVSRVTISASRTGNVVTLSSSASRYRPSVSAFRPWVGRAVALSYRTCPTCTWHHITTRTTDGKGRIAPRRVLAPTAREYRAEITKMSTTWGTTSAPVRR
jgi:hypothetical protein